jgi:hypothetical protein
VASHFKRDIDRIEGVQRRATKMIKGLENKTYVERLRQAGMFYLEKRRLGGNITVCRFIKGFHTEKRDQFSLVNEDRIRSNRLQFQKGKFKLNIRTNFVTI